MKIVKTILFVLFALMMINAGLDKFFHYNPQPEMDAEMQKIFSAMVSLKWVLPLVAVVEIFSGILILFPKTRTLGAIMIFPVIIGILCHNATFFMLEGLIFAGVFFLINLWMLFDNKEKIKALF